MSDAATTTAATLLRAKLSQREGCTSFVIRDSRGFLTVGIGHRVVPADNLALGDRIAADRIEALYEADTAMAMQSAIVLASICKVESPAFTAALADVCFQLGVNWTLEFPLTWEAICAGQNDTAADMLDGTKWQKETPVRVADFQASLRDLA